MEVEAEMEEEEKKREKWRMGTNLEMDQRGKNSFFILFGDEAEAGEV